MRYGVTGAAGFIGSHLYEELARRGHEVVGYDSFTDYYDPAIKERNARGFDLQRIDLAEDDLDFGGLDGLFHLAGQPGVRSFGDVFPHYLRRNLLATQRVFEAAARDGVKVAFASSSSVYGDAAAYPTTEETPTRPLSPYGITKLACEHLAYAYRAGFGLECVVFRYFTVYGPRQRPDMAFARLVDALHTGRPFPLFGDGEQSRNFTFVADAVDATILVLDRGTGTYNIGGGSEATVNEVIATLEEVSGHTLRLERGPVVKGDVRRTSADTTRLRELGWEPRTSLRDGLEQQWLAVRE